MTILDEPALVHATKRSWYRLHPHARDDEWERMPEHVRLALTEDARLTITAYLEATQ